MSPEAVHAILADLENKAVRVGANVDGRETWRFRVDAGGIEYELHFYPHDEASPLTLKMGGGRAAREFTQLQSLQKLAIPATRVIANLKGLRLGDRKGDACIVVHEPADLPLNQVLRTPPASHRTRLELLAALIERLESLGRVNMCPTPLRPQAFAMRGPTLLLADGDCTLAGGITADRLFELDAATRHVTRASDRVRVWRHFFPAIKPPRRSRPLQRSARRAMRDALAGNGFFGTIESGDWSGRFLRQLPTIVPWSTLGGLTLCHDDWQRVLPELLDVSNGTPIKSDRTSLVTTQTIELGGRTIEVVAKRPGFKTGFRGETQRYRRARTLRTWLKNWRLLASGLPVEVPLIVLERRIGWRLVEQIYVVERVPGPTLEKIDLDAMPADERSHLMRETGRTLRQLERAGFRHLDAKSANWIVWRNALGVIKPIMVDLDSTRTYGPRGQGVARLALSLRMHSPGLTENDLATLDAGFRSPR